MYVHLCICLFNSNFRYMALCTGHTRTRNLQCSHASVGFAQARPNKGRTRCCHPRFPFPFDWHISHSPKHWSTEETMLQYIENIIVPYVEKVREVVGTEKAALVIIDNFKGQITTAVNNLLEQNILVCLLPPNTTDFLQPMDIAIS